MWAVVFPKTAIWYELPMTGFLPEENVKITILGSWAITSLAFFFSTTQLTWARWFFLSNCWEKEKKVKIFGLSPWMSGKSREEVKRVREDRVLRNKKQEKNKFEK